MVSRIVIQHISGSKANQIEPFTLGETDQLTIGRDPSSTIVFDPLRDDAVSRNHATIKIQHGEKPVFQLVDAGSSNGTRVNGQRIIGATELIPGDTVELGSGGPKFLFDVQPRPGHLMARTRVIASTSPAATRIIDNSNMASRAGPATAPTPSPAPTRVGVGHETVQRMIATERQATSKVWMYSLAGILLVAGGLAGGMYWKYRQEHDKIAGALHTAEVNFDKRIGNQVAGVDRRLGMSAEDIIHKFGNATVYIDVHWRLYDRGTGKPLYHKTMTLTKGGPKLPCFIELPSKQVVRWLVTDDENRTNEDIGTPGTGTGFVISSQGFILTNKHIAAGWMIPYRHVGSGNKGLLFQMNDKDLKPTEFDLSLQRDSVRNLTNWVPDNGGIVFATAFPIPVGASNRIFEGHNERLDIRFPGNRLSIAGRLVRASTDADVAELKIDTEQTLSVVEMAGDEGVKTGEHVTVLGYPDFSVKTMAQVTTVEAGHVQSRQEIVPEPTVSEGLISRLSSRLSSSEQSQGQVTTVGQMGDVYQLSVPTGPGNSGGPVFNSAGKVIGLFTYGSTQRESLTYAVPIKYGRDLIQIQRAQ